MDDLRNHLFETIEKLKDDEKPLDLERARAISGVAQTIINSAKVEVQYLREVGGVSENRFFTKQLPAASNGKSNGNGR